MGQTQTATAAAPPATAKLAAAGPELPPQQPGPAAAAPADQKWWRPQPAVP